MLKRLIGLMILMLAVFLGACNRSAPADVTAPGSDGEPLLETSIAATIATHELATAPVPEATPEEEATPESIGVPPPSEELIRLRANPWQWVSFTSPAEQFAVEAPERYVVTFGGDGSLVIVADCNTVLGQHVPSDDGDLAITPGPATLAACPPDSRGDQFISLLTGVESYAFDSDTLLLDQPLDAGTLAFTPAGETALDWPRGESFQFADNPDLTYWDDEILLGSVRVPLAAFSGVDLTDLADVGLVFDQTGSGDVFVTDLEYLRYAELRPDVAGAFPRAMCPMTWSASCYV